MWLAYIHGNQVGHELRDETSEEWSDEVHRQLRGCTALETEVQDRANVENLGVVRRNVARYCKAYGNNVHEIKEKPRKLKADTKQNRQSWFRRRTSSAAVAAHPGASSTTDPQP